MFSTAKVVEAPFKPRTYQKGFLDALDPPPASNIEPLKRACIVWHRRAGKDTSALHLEAFTSQNRIGNYWHLFPKQTQARKAIWKGINRDGKRIIDYAFPKELRSKTLDQEMMIEFRKGSTWQLCGSDQYDNLVGANPVGVVFSEWPLCNPVAWDYIRPILLENNGWAAFIYTPRGKNHGHTLYKMAQSNPEWYCELLTIDDTTREDGSPVITPAMIQSERDDGMSEELIQQEYYCSFDAQIPGAVYAEEMRRVQSDKRICRVPIEPTLDVHTFWDLGVNKKSGAMAIWFVQAIDKEIRLINYHQDHGKGMAAYITYLKEFKEKHKIHYGKHYAPHDIGVTEMMSGKTREATAREMGIQFIKVPRVSNIGNGIEATRRLFSRFWFDEERCDLGISAVSSYHWEFDEKKQQFTSEPVHDWSSDGADALRQLGQAWNDSVTGTKARPRPHTATSNFNPLGD